jgi:hypothetical protein
LARRFVPLALLAATIAAQLAVVFTVDVRPGLIVVDFHNAYYPAAEHVLGGESPYREAGADLSDRMAYVYPPLTAVLVSPLTLLPPERADLLWLMLLINALAAALLLSGVRSRTALALAVIALPTLSALQTGSVTLVLAVLLALAWRYRDSPAVAGSCIGLAVALKLFVWPLIVWLVATRRYRAAAIATAGAAVGLLSVLPFMSLRDYLAMADDLSALSAPDSYTLYALFSELGAPHQLAQVGWLAVGLGVLVAGRRSFGLCVLASLLLTPIVWMQYFALLAVALAAAGAGAAAWAVLPLFWLGAGDGNGATWQLAVVLALVGSVLYTLRFSARRPGRHREEAEPVVRLPAEHV